MKTTSSLTSGLLFSITAALILTAGQVSFFQFYEAWLALEFLFSGKFWWLVLCTIMAMVWLVLELSSGKPSLRKPLPVILSRRERMVTPSFPNWSGWPVLKRQNPLAIQNQ